MALTITQVLEAFFIAVVLVLMTSPHLISSQAALQELQSFFHLF